VGGWRVVDADGRDVPGIVHVGSAGEAVALVCGARG
jgi:hypothetical protein